MQTTIKTGSIEEHSSIKHYSKALLSPLSDGRRSSLSLKQTLLDFSPVCTKVAYAEVDIKDSKSLCSLIKLNESEIHTNSVAITPDRTVEASQPTQKSTATDNDSAIQKVKRTVKKNYVKQTIISVESPSMCAIPKQEPRKRTAQISKQKEPASRHYSVDSRTSRNTTATQQRSKPKSVSVSPKKPNAQGNVPQEGAVEKEKYQTRLTNFGIRRTARQFAKFIQREREANAITLLQQNVESGMKVIVTEEKGRGVIVTRTFEEGEFVVEYAGELISEKEAKQREAVYKQDPTIGSYMFFFSHAGQRYCVDATKETNRLGRLINHSRLRPNCAVRIIPIDAVPRLALFTNRIVNPGEELLYDYGDRDKTSLEAHPWLKT